jgi:hypothetical protein
MLKKTVVALGAVAILVALGSASYAQQNGTDWQRAYNSKAGKNCVGGTASVDENAASAYPSWWSHCR